MVVVSTVVGSSKFLVIRFNETSVHCYKVLGIIHRMQNAFHYVSIQNFKAFYNYNILSYSLLTYR